MITAKSNGRTFVARFGHVGPNSEHRGKSMFQVSESFGEGNELEVIGVETNVHEGDQFCRKEGRKRSFRHAMRKLRKQEGIGRPERKAIGDAVRLTVTPFHKPKKKDEEEV